MRADNFTGKKQALGVTSMSREELSWEGPRAVSSLGTSLGTGRGRQLEVCLSPIPKSPACPQIPPSP